MTDDPPKPAHQHGAGCCSHGGAESAPADHAKDPVCGMDVDPHKTQHRAEHAGRTYYFCSGGCRTKFLADPQRYLSPEAAKAEPVTPGAIYTCPMHPEIRQVGPGSCPICGMALEPETVTAGEEDTSQLDDMTRRFWISAVLTAPLFVYAMSEMLPGDPLTHLIPGVWRQWGQFALATPVVLWGGWPIMTRGVQSLRTMNLNMFTLIALGVGVA
jgi:Cu+-exporting ATPase